MIPDVLGSLALFVLLSLGCGWSVAARLRGSAGERLLAAVALSLISVFLFAWAIYILHLSWSLLWAFPVIAAGLLGIQWRSLRAAWQEEEMRELVISQAIVTGWCIGWLALVVTYSGGNWVGDWFGHWQRAVFFLERGPHDILFNGFDALTSRPPLANIVVGAFMFLTKNDFAHYQLAMTFLGSLAFMPAALLAQRWGGIRAVAVLAVVFMGNPMFVQNATFAWTKLSAAFFTLAAIYFFLRVREANDPSAGILFAVSLAAALLAHYSAGPYAVILAIAWVGAGWARRYDSSWWKETVMSAAAGAILLATWFGWSLAVYGVDGTFLTNTSVTDKGPAGTQFWTALLNIRDTLVPHFLRDVDYGYIAQGSRWGWWRDWFFQLYQINFFFAFGSVAWLAIAVVLVKAGRSISSCTRAAWTMALTATLVLGIIVHGGRSEWGLAHICLQPIVLMGLAVAAARWETLGAGWRWTIIAGAGVDFLLGIALQFGAQSFLLDQWLAPDRSAAETLSSYSPHAIININAKIHYKWTFFGQRFVGLDGVVLMLLFAVLLLALVRLRRRTPNA